MDDKSADQSVRAKEPVFPPADIPTYFSDGFLNLARSPEVVKFYIARIDPSLNSTEESITQAVAQVVMPMSSFVEMCAFFEQALEGYIKEGVVKQAALDTARAKFRSGK